MHHADYFPEYFPCLLSLGCKQWTAGRATAGDWGAPERKPPERGKAAVEGSEGGKVEAEGGREG